MVSSDEDLFLKAVDPRGSASRGANIVLQEESGGGPSTKISNKDVCENPSKTVVKVSTKARTLDALLSFFRGVWDTGHDWTWRCQFLKGHSRYRRVFEHELRVRTSIKRTTKQCLSMNPLLHGHILVWTRRGPAVRLVKN